ncbi:hypothetical protein RhiirC2_792910 [Rhizophagus irregularis]|uniref:Uncharacterized protein n=1 Tax=Rhizophagus irregularis TaxID=588596 RepID=A0A2N1MFC6_9GLOM|nr:hypothetical protein RhiirC2_793448 [Rhizophagus irregularis]PKK60726.1 hypothetical protein RhiirC2_792910 [Rhizophagus irregularis]
MESRKKTAKAIREYQYNAVKKNTEGLITIKELLFEEIEKIPGWKIEKYSKKNLVKNVSAYVKRRHQYVINTNFLEKKQENGTRETIRKYLYRYPPEKETSNSVSNAVLTTETTETVMTMDEQDEELGALIAVDENEIDDMTRNNLIKNKENKPDIVHSVPTAIDEITYKLQNLGLELSIESHINSIIRNLQQLKYVFKTAVPFVGNREILPVDDEHFTQIYNTSTEFIDNFKEEFPSLVPHVQYNDFHVMIEYATSRYRFLSVNRSRNITKILLPDQVQTILNECGFDSKDVVSWEEPIEVPIGVNTNIFIAREAIINGLNPLETFPYSELDGYGKGIGDLNEIIGPIISRRNKKINIRNLLYRGERRYRDIPRAIRYGIRPRNPELSDFGEGFYTTPSIVYAINHVRSVENDALLIFDWKDSGGNNVTTKYINENEWISTVKGHICADDITKPEPPDHSEDIWVGAISGNYDEVIRCSKPQCSNFMQVVGITPAGWKAFEERLIAIIYVYS